MFTLQSNLNKLFETNKQIIPIPANPDAKIIFHDHPYILYQQITLDNNYLAYQNAILQARTALRRGVLSSPYQQSFELNTGAQSLKINFQGTYRQSDWLEVSLVYDKSNQHQTVYDSYDLELASRFVQMLTIENASSQSGQLEFNADNEDDKHWLYQMFVTYNCDGCSTAPLTQYHNNEIYQELPTEAKCFDDMDERLYIDMRQSKGYTDDLEKLTQDASDINLTVKLKVAAAKKMRLRVLGYSQAEYWYTTSSKGYIMTFKNYSVTKVTLQHKALRIRHGKTKIY